jgi:hypothetical protein
MSYDTTILADNPTAYYETSETTGSTAFDATSNHYDATLAGGFTLAQPGATNDGNTAIALSATGTFILPYTLNVTTFSAISIEFWINASTSWQHFAITCDDHTTLAYLNGSITAIGTTALVEVGVLFDFAGSYAAASFAKVAIYNYKLSSSQVAAHYAAATATVTPPTNFTYGYGSFAINAHSGGLGYFLVAKDLDFPEFKPQLSPLALYDGHTITGYQVGERQIQVDLVIVGTSRIDCIARKDALEAALALRDQQLVLHEDGRYWIANAISGKAKFAAGQGIVQCKIPVSFICANPYAIAPQAAAPYNTGDVAYTFQSPPGTYQSTVFSVAGGGTTYSWPRLHLTHSLPDVGSTTLTSQRTHNSTYTSLPVASAPAIGAGLKLLLLYIDTSGSQPVTHGQKVTASSNVSPGATSIPVNSFTANATFPATNTTVMISTAWNHVYINQLTDNYQIEADGSGDQSFTLDPINGNGSALLLPQMLGDTLDIYCDPAGNPGWSILTSALSTSFTIPSVGAFPPLQPAVTSWQVAITSDYQPAADFSVIWTPRYMS